MGRRRGHQQRRDPSPESERWTITNGCSTGKRAFSSRKGARDQNLRQIHNGLDRLSAYKCAECHQWHLGHLPRDVKSGKMPRSEILPKAEFYRRVGRRETGFAVGAKSEASGSANLAAVDDPSSAAQFAAE